MPMRHRPSCSSSEWRTDDLHAHLLCRRKVKSEARPAARGGAREVGAEVQTVGGDAAPVRLLRDGIDARDLRGDRLRVRAFQAKYIGPEPGMSRRWEYVSSL